MAAGAAGDKMRNKLVIAGILVVVALFALYFLIDKVFLYPALIGAMMLMHLEMHGKHEKR